MYFSPIGYILANSSFIPCILYLSSMSYLELTRLRLSSSISWKSGETRSLMERSITTGFINLDVTHTLSFIISCDYYS